jgi:hypothetical protein
LAEQIGVDTNYVAAMQLAAAHLPGEAVRPAMVLFTDGKHDVGGVPVSRVQPELERLFGSRSPFALLPVGMGLNPDERGPLVAGLEALRVIREMPACLGGAALAWPQVVFESAAEAGNAVAVALQDVTCTFTVAPSSPPVLAATATPRALPGYVESPRLFARDGSIEIDWIAPAIQTEPIVDYLVRCRTGEGPWIEVDDGRSTDTLLIVDGLTNGLSYECEIAAATSSRVGDWKAAPMTVTPRDRPAPPSPPSVQALDRAVAIQAAGDPASPDDTFRYECSPDGGASWPVQSAASPGKGPATLGPLVNGVEYVCRAYAENVSGRSDPSALSDIVRPCGSMLQCNPVSVGVLGGLGLVSVGGMVVALILLFRRRVRGYVVAVVDVVHTANLGYGSRLGIGFVRGGSSGEVTDIRPDRSARAEIRIRALGQDRFEVTDRFGRHTVRGGEPVVATDSLGVRHSVTLRGFRPGTASNEISQA